MVGSALKTPAPGSLSAKLLDAALNPTAADESTSYSFRIIAGSYERLLYGLNVTLAADSDAAAGNSAAPVFADEPAAPPSQADDDEEKDVNAIQPVFIYPAHITAIRCLAVSNNLLATGASDEHVKVYNLHSRSEVGSLLHHSGTITSVCFYKKSWIITAAEDGMIALVRVRDWALVKELSGHRGAVTALAMHPSGKLLLSAGRDGTLKLWDLTKGSCAYSMKLPHVADKLVWHPDGNMYVVLMDRLVQVYATTGGTYGISFRQRINGIAFAPALEDGSEDRVLFAAGEDKHIYAYRLAVPQPTEAPEASKSKATKASAAPAAVTSTLLRRSITGHTARVKDLAVHGAYAVTITTSGQMAVWSAYALAAEDGAAAPTRGSPATPLCTYDAKVRLTCLALAARPVGTTDTHVARRKRAARAAAGEDSDVAVEMPSESEYESETEQVLGYARPRARLQVQLESESGAVAQEVVKEEKRLSTKQWKQTQALRTKSAASAKPSKHKRAKPSV